MVITCASDIMKKYTALIERGLAYIVPKDPITAPVAIHHALEQRGAVHAEGRLPELTLARADTGAELSRSR